MRLKNQILLLLSLLCMSIPYVSAQQLEYKMAVGRSVYIPIKPADRHVQYDHAGGLCYLFAASYENKKQRKNFPKIGIRLEHYAGELNTQSNYMGFAGISSASLSKTLLGIDFTLLRLKLNHFILESGVNLGVMVQHKLSGYNTSTIGSANDPVRMLTRDDLRLTYFGLHASVRYPMPINSVYYCFPVFDSYLGLSQELLSSPVKVHALRTTFGVGIGKKI